MILSVLGLAAAAIAADAAPARECPAFFRDVAAEVGLTFRHDRGGTPEYHLPETMGSGVAWLDYDNDGWMDLYVVQSGPFPPQGSAKARDRLFHNVGGKRFVDVTEKAGIRDTAYGMGVAAADFDNDGFVDLYVTNYGGNILYRNNGDGTFTDVTAKAGVGGPRWGTSSAWADIDGDGDLDLFVCQYADDRKDKDLFCGDPRTGVRDYCPPIMYPNTNSVLYRNDGGGRFTDITSEAGLGDAPGKGLGVLFVDVDQDNRPDIYVANDEVMNRLFRNAGNGHFEDVSIVSGTAFGLQGNPQGGMGVDAGDLDGDGLVDIVVANFETENNSFFRNLGGGTFDDLSVSSGFGPPTLNFVKFGLVLLDIDGDGNLDAHVTNGHIYDRPKRQGATEAQRSQLLWNDGHGKFVERSCGAAFDKAFVGRGSAVADFDNDGDPDVAISSSNGELQLLRNDGSHAQWLGISLLGTKSNRQGIGARLVAETPGGKKRTRWVQAGSSYLSSSDPRVLFGLGQEKSVGTLTIYWPSGTVQVLKDVAAGSYITVKERAGQP